MIGESRIARESIESTEVMAELTLARIEGRFAMMAPASVPQEWRDMADRIIAILSEQKDVPLVQLALHFNDTTFGFGFRRSVSSWIGETQWFLNNHQKRDVMGQIDQLGESVKAEAATLGAGADLYFQGRFWTEIARPAFIQEYQRLSKAKAEALAAASGEQERTEIFQRFQKQMLPIYNIFIVASSGEQELPLLEPLFRMVEQDPLDDDSLFMVKESFSNRRSRDLSRFHERVRTILASEAVQNNVDFLWQWISMFESTRITPSDGRLLFDLIKKAAGTGSFDLTVLEAIRKAAEAGLTSTSKISEDRVLALQIVDFLKEQTRLMPVPTSISLGKYNISNVDQYLSERSTIASVIKALSGEDVSRVPSEKLSEHFGLPVSLSFEGKWRGNLGHQEPEAFDQRDYIKRTTRGHVKGILRGAAQDGNVLKIELETVDGLKKYALYVDDVPETHSKEANPDIVGWLPQVDSSEATDASKNVIGYAEWQKSLLRTDTARVVDMLRVSELGRGGLEALLPLAARPNFIYTFLFDNPQGKELPAPVLAELQKLGDDEKLKILQSGLAVFAAIKAGVMNLSADTESKEQLSPVKVMEMIATPETQGGWADKDPRLNELYRIANATWETAVTTRGLAAVVKKLKAAGGGAWDLLPESEIVKDRALLRGTASFVLELIKEQQANEGYTEEQRQQYESDIDQFAASLVADGIAREDVNRVRKALFTAMFIHRHQKRDDGTPYFPHILTTVKALRENFKAVSVDALIDATYHDTREDQPAIYAEIKNYVDVNLDTLEAVINDYKQNIARLTGKPGLEKALQEAQEKVQVLEAAYRLELRHAARLRLSQRVLSHDYDVNDPKYKQDIDAILAEIQQNPAKWEAFDIKPTLEDASRVFYYRQALTDPTLIWKAWPENSSWYNDAFVREVQLTKLSDILANAGEYKILSLADQEHHLKRLQLALIEFVARVDPRFLTLDDKKVFVQALREKLKDLAAPGAVAEEMVKVEKVLAVIDAAGNVSIQNVVKGPTGGINFAQSALSLQIKRDGAGVPLPVSQQNLDSIHIDGLVP
ncbi:MAG: hypothetical protein HQL22_12720, partial [Candidatus Omnitrophica bacterium]|nr:hypothetical protein [Candidatus Omnitrophota bacterium]